MTQQITPGRYRGLKACSLPQADVFGMLAFDQRGNYRRMMPDGTPYETYVQIKMEVASALSQSASAVLLDPIYGLSAAMQVSGTSGLLMALEKTGYTGDATYRRVEFLDGWSPEKIRKMGANAVKILIYYSPEQPELADELDELVAKTAEECHAWDIPLFVEPLSYSIDESYGKDSAEFAAKRPDIVVETARRLSRTGTDILKMEFPVDLKYNADHDEWRKQCTRLSDASIVPWVLLSAGVDFEQYEPQVQIACESGATGFLGGRAIWKEAVPLSTEERANFLATIGTERLARLSAITAANARPWSDFYTTWTSAEDWYKSYS
ncbi:MAG: hypothetical protein CL607_21885 [Anaerolineaceae bacterium]|nr:hypothetical protein [Anaerolineaceae bacterium]